MAVAVRHENIRGAGCQRALDGSVDFQRGEFAAAFVIAGFRKAVIRRVYHARHALHIRHHVDFHTVRILAVCRIESVGQILD